MTCPTVFVSYCREEQQWVLGLAKALQRAGYSPWVDTEELRAGVRWEEYIGRRIRDAGWFISVISQGASSHRYWYRELLLALEVQQLRPAQRYLVPVLLDPCPIPESVAGFQVLDLSAGGSYDRLVETLDEELRARGLAMTMEVTAGPDQGKRFIITGAMTNIGRETSNEVTLADRGVSNQHGRIDVRRGEVLFHHLSGKKSSRYYGARRARVFRMGQGGSVIMQHGDRLQLGQTELVLHIVDLERIQSVETTEGNTEGITES